MTKDDVIDRLFERSNHGTQREDIEAAYDAGAKGGEPYNGWKNYETWLVGLWLDNDEADYRYWQTAAEECNRAAADGLGNPYADEQAARLLLADRLKDELENAKDDLLEANKLGASLWADLLGAALGQVDWIEVADHILQE